MELLRSSLLSGVDLTSRMISGIQTAAEEISNLYNTVTNTTTTDSSINIENVNVNVEVKEVSNDYDARRIGSQALDEIVRVARKTGNLSSSRR